MSSTDEKSISLEIVNRGQDVIYREVLCIGQRKARIEICSDAYASQCYAKIWCWDGNEWKELHSLLAMWTLPGNAYKENGDCPSLYDEDRGKLIRVFREVTSDGV